MDGNMTKEKKALLYLKKIKDPKVRAELRRDIEKLIRLKGERDRADRADKISKYYDKYQSTKLH